LSELSKRVLRRLEDAGFQTRVGDAVPFGEQLPLVTGVAWEKKTAQMALLAEGSGKLELASWRQLLIAGSGIRHQLAGDGASALGTPLIVAIVDQEAAGDLRQLAERLAEDFAIFNRVDLNLVLPSDVNDRERLDDALAPLLPRCRRILGSEISKREVQRFWQLLRSEVEKAATELDPSFGRHRDAAGRTGSEALIGESANATELLSPTPIGRIEARHFRSIELLELDLADVNVIHGPNGSGKTTLVEAMELAWAGASQRKPADVAAGDYAKHLPRDGSGEFAIAADGRQAEAPRDAPCAELSRCVLTHEAITALASETPEERFSALLEVTGLEIPDLKVRTEALLRESKREADRALSAAGMANLPRANSVGLKHLREELKGELVSRYAALPELATPEGTLASVSGGAFSPRQWASDAHLVDLLKSADEAVVEGSRGKPSETEISAILDEAGEAVAELLAERSKAAAACRQLLEELRTQVRAAKAEDEPSEGSPAAKDEDAPIGVELAARWLSHSETIRSEAERFHAAAAELEDESWAERLHDYASALEDAARQAPRAALEQLSKPQVKPRAAPTPRLGGETLRAAGFDETPIDPEVVGPVLSALSDALDAHVAELQGIAKRLERHPARVFDEQSQQVMEALCRFELARVLRREGPVLQASERLVDKLLDERLAPVVRELVAAIVRFEWYFKPLKMTGRSRQVRLGGLATEREDLDARLLLNSAEQTVLGIAWFLALHMLQPEERRQVLVLDDPTSGFDAANTAGFASTLRAFIRLLRPKQVVVATHDDQVAAMLAEELAVVDGWPASVARVRFQRDAKDCSEAIKEWASDDQRQVEPEAEQLGLVGETPAR
jgi:energy-coupling factor transporter ATP-binding protein EcfA2